MLRSILVVSHAVAALAVILLTTALVVESLAPPHPSYEDWESVHQMRRRLNVTYDYEPVHLSHEHCRYLTEEQCREEDEGLGHAKAGRHGRRLNTSLGQSLRVLVVLLRFSDHVDRILPDKAYFEELFNDDGTTDKNVVGSAKEFFRYNSLGKYRVQYDVRDWHTAENTQAFYSKGQYGLIGNVPMQEMFYTAMDAIDQSGINWLDGYVDDWGLLHHLVVLTSGYSAESGPRPCLTDDPPQNRIWSQGSASAQSGWLSRDFYQVNGYAIASAFQDPTCNGTTAEADPADLGVIVHEYSHGFGLIDLYDQDKDDPKIAIGGTGRFDLMSNAHGWDRNAFIPGHLGAFSRMSISGWLEPILIDVDGYYAIQPAEISAHIYKITHNFPDGEYLLIELRQPIKWDENWPAGGIVILHVDEKAGKQNTRGYPGKAGWPADHYRVSVIQADGNYDIEKGNNMGDEGDFWVKGDVLAPGPIFPNTDSIQGGIQNATGLTITIHSDPGFIMTFQVEGIGSSRAPRVGKFGTKDLERPDPNTTGSVLAWMLSMLGGMAAMVGIMVIVL